MSTLTKWFEENRIDEVEALIPDIAGTARGKFVPVESYSENEGIRLPEGMFSQSVTGDYVWETDTVDETDPDMHLLPDLNSVRLVPWASEPTAQIIHDCRYADGKVVDIAPRYILQKILNLYKRKGWEPVVAPEIEFYLVKINTDPDNPLEPPVGRSGRQEASRQTFSVDAVNEFESVIEDIYNYAEVQGLHIDTLTHEDGLAQLEVNFRHGNALDLADQVFLFKRTAREAAFKNKMYATFMAKPHEKQPGSSMHLHQSIIDRKSGENIFVNTRGKPNKAFSYYVGGLQHYMPASMCINAPNVNSYRRITRYNSAPINTHWGTDNRTVGLRMPLSTPDATRIENRLLGADVNPYLAFATSLAAGYLGMKNKIRPGEELKGSAYDQPITLPRNLQAALEMMRENDDLQDILGRRFVKLYMSVKELEYETFIQVISSWERQHLLLNV